MRLRLCDWHGLSQVSQLKPGQLVRVNESGDPHNQFEFARVEHLNLRVEVELLKP
jgi:hypothetical protein